MMTMGEANKYWETQERWLAVDSIKMLGCEGGNYYVTYRKLNSDELLVMTISWSDAKHLKFCLENRVVTYDWEIENLLSCATSVTITDVTPANKARVKVVNKLLGCEEHEAFVIYYNRGSTEPKVVPICSSEAKYLKYLIDDKNKKPVEMLEKELENLTRETVTLKAPYKEHNACTFTMKNWRKAKRKKPVINKEYEQWWADLRERFGMTEKDVYEANRWYNRLENDPKEYEKFWADIRKTLGKPKTKA